VLGNSGRVKLSPHVVDADADGYPVRIKGNYITVKTIEKVAACVTSDAGVSHAEGVVGVSCYEKVFDLADVAVAEVIEAIEKAE
jgi:hypothetical protein